MASLFSRKKYLISGVGPGSNGVGRLMNALVPEYLSQGYQVFACRSPQPLRPLVETNSYWAVALEILARNIDKLFFTLRCLSIFRGEIVFLHPQRAGYLLLFFLVRFNKVNLYVMDNSFFCICSYNTHPQTHSECFDCIGKPRPHRLCLPFPVRISKALNIFYLKYLHSISSRLIFFAQNNLQKELLCLHFGEHIAVKVIGMSAENSILPNQNFGQANSRIITSCRYDVVFHGVSNAPKGLFYVLELAKFAPELSFLVPDNKSNVVRITEIFPPSNVSCIEMSWESGLREAVSSARLVINPSMWSAPIEGALIKSAQYNNNVATVFTLYAYEREILSIVNHLRLPRDPYAASILLREFVENLK